jgi:flavin reductase (DIM6/NTAB) family NADH-FMN oxidoreductase RutF
LSSTTWPVLRQRPRLGLSVLAESHGPAARNLAAKGVDRFAGISWESNDARSVFVHGATLWLDVTRWREVSAGDHNIAILKIVQLWGHPDVSPLVFHGSRFRQLSPVG